jgi:resuscitation-promoting factor RpfB
MWGERSAGGLLIAAGLLLTGCAGEDAAPKPLADVAGTTKSSPAPAVKSTKPVAKASAPVSTPVEATPRVVTKNLVVLRSVPFKKKTVKDPELPQGEVVVTTRGVKGTNKVTYAVTYTDGRETGRRLMRQQVTEPAVTQVTSVGTKVDETEPAGDCDPNYSGACVPIASDVDCSSGSGNGPAYVTGPVQVIGDDIYDLDRDSDGVGCEDG